LPDNNADFKATFLLWTFSHKGCPVMRQKAIRAGILWRWLVALILVFCLLPMNTRPVAALSPTDYYSYSYNVEFSKPLIVGGESFYATVTIEAECIKDLPLSPSVLSVTGRIIAEHQTSGARMTLNSEYTSVIKPLPGKVGETAKVSEVVLLKFPQGSQNGSYDVVGELIDARVKVLFVWISVTKYLPTSETGGIVTYRSTGGGGGGGGGSSEEESEDVSLSPEPVVSPHATDVSAMVDIDGIFTEKVFVKSTDGKCELTINGGTSGLDREGNPLTWIAVTDMKDGPAPSKNYHLIGLAYDLEPDGATFNPPINLALAYDESLIPEGAFEEKLVVAMWDEETGKWVILDQCTIHTESNTIIVPISHFSAFAVLVYARPASIVTSEFSVFPSEVNAGEEITIRTLVTNTGDLNGSHKVTLRIDNVVVMTKDVVLEGGASAEVVFNVTKEAAGTYEVNVDGLVGTFTITSPATFIIGGLSVTPAQVHVGEEVRISALLTNTSNISGGYKVVFKVDNVPVKAQEVILGGGTSQEVVFTTTREATGTYSVTIDNLSGQFVVKLPPEPLNWWLIGSAIAACLVLIVIVSLVVVRRLRRT